MIRIWLCCILLLFGVHASSDDFEKEVGRLSSFKGLIPIEEIKESIGAVNGCTRTCDLHDQ